MNTLLMLVRLESGIRSRVMMTAGALATLAVLGIGLMYASAGVAAEAGFGPSAGALVNVYMLIVPLVALTLGALGVVRDREAGTLAYLAVAPVTVSQLFWSKWTSLALSIVGIVFGAFTILMVALAALHVEADVASMLQFMLATALLGLAMGACGMSISIVSRSTPMALAGALALWLFFVIFADVGVMAGALATHLQTGALLWTTSLNPIEAYKIASICALSGSVDVLGPGGRLASDIFGTLLMPFMVAIIAVWAAAATAFGRWALGRTIDA